MVFIPESEVFSYAALLFLKFFSANQQNIFFIIPKNQDLYFNNYKSDIQWDCHVTSECLEVESVESWQGELKNMKQTSSSSHRI
jgi:hypothetical protein